MGLRLASRQESGDARRLYVFSLWSLLWLPLSALAGFCLGPLALAAPALIIILALLGFSSKRAFVRWHAWQWAALTLPFLAFLSISFVLVFYFDSFYFSSFMLFLNLVISLVWYAGNILGLSQANHGRCWLWETFGSPELRTWAEQTSSRPPAISPVWDEKGGLVPLSQSSVPTGASASSPATFKPPPDPYQAFGRGQSLKLADKRAEASACFLLAFRRGRPELRRRALAELEQLGEVEMF